MENIASPRPAAAVNVLAVAGSLRRNSINRQLLLAAAAAAPSGLNIRVFDAIDEIPLFNEDLESGPHKAPLPVVEFRRAVAEADGLLIATPEYNQSIPAVTKNLIDWLSRADTRILANKPTTVLGATVGAWGTRLAQTSARQTLFVCGAQVMNTASLYIANAGGVFRDGKLTDAGIQANLQDFLAAFDRWIRWNKLADEVRRSHYT